MSETSRRRFIGVTGAGAAAVGATAFVPGTAWAGQAHPVSYTHLTLPTN